MLFGPMTIQDAQEHLWRCAARAAQVRGLPTSDWYTVEEIYDHLRKNHPETLKFFETFSTAYLNWAALSYRTHEARLQNVCDPATLEDLNVLTKKRDDTRRELLQHLGLG